MKYSVPLMQNAFFDEAETKKRLSKFILHKTRLSMDTYCQKFEKKFAKFHKSKYAVFFNSGSSSNLAILQTLLNLKKIKIGDTIAFSSLTWATNVMPIMQLGFKPLPLDIDKENLNIKLSDVDKLKNCKVLFVTNALGFCADLEQIKKKCKKKKIILIEDNAEALGTTNHKNQLTGSFGEMSSFSFFVAHHMSTIEGGMVITNDFNQYEMLKMVRSNGWDRQLSAKTKKNLQNKNNTNSFYSKYTFYHLAYNLRPTEINAFVGIEQLKKLKKNLLLRNKIFFEVYKSYLKNNNLVQLSFKKINFFSPFSFPVICKTESYKKKLLKKFLRNRVECRPMIAGNMTLQPFYKNIYKKKSLPNCEFVHKNGFYFGIHPEMSSKQIKLLQKLFV
jgi:CDP-4-dehydro-6-deoxyglucose reductase, E1|tara:strand:+ start:8372 stop:9538 length:1167 start_codon:yes stop_codon:yes gene_type:complete